MEQGKHEKQWGDPLRHSGQTMWRVRVRSIVSGWGHDVEGSKIQGMGRTCSMSDVSTPGPALTGLGGSTGLCGCDSGIAVCSGVWVCILNCVFHWWCPQAMAALPLCPSLALLCSLAHVISCPSSSGG